MVKRNPMTTVNQVNNTLQQAGVSISKSTIKRRLYEGKYRGFAAASRIGRLDWTSLKKKKCKKAGTVLDKRALDT